MTDQAVPPIPGVLAQRYEPAVPLDQVELHPRNPRRGDPEAIAGSVRSNGFYGALVVQESTRRIIVGNHRYLAAAAEGLGALPVLFVDVDDARAERIAIADNRTGDLASWDHALLLELLEGQDDLAGVGFTESAMADLERLVRGAPPEEFPSVDEDLAVDYRCPKCCYAWSGKAIADCEGEG